MCGGKVIDIKQISCKGMGWILSRDRIRWWAVLNIVNIFFKIIFNKTTRNMSFI
jgi:hypothetical protein